MPAHERRISRIDDEDAELGEDRQDDRHAEQVETAEFTEGEHSECGRAHPQRQRQRRRVERMLRRLSEPVQEPLADPQSDQSQQGGKAEVDHGYAVGSREIGTTRLDHERLARTATQNCEAA